MTALDQIGICITRANVESVLDGGKLYAAMRNGRWWRLRRNGKTQRWVKDAKRIRIPVKAGLRATTSITENDFDVDGWLKPDNFRHVDDIPANLRT